MKAYAFRPWLFGSLLAVFIMFGLGYVGATGYLIYRDDLMDAAVSRQVDMQYAYEDRISRLRAEIDRVTSKHLVEAQSIEEQVASLSDRQQALLRRQELLDQVLDRAREAGLPLVSSTIDMPKPRPDGPAVSEDAPEADGPASHALSYAPDAPSQADIITGSIIGGRNIGGGGSAMPASAKPASAVGKHERVSALGEARMRPVLKQMDGHLKGTLQAQSEVAEALVAASLQETARLRSALNDIGFSSLVPESARAGEATGGPFIPAEPDNALQGLAFVETIDAIDAQLEDLRTMRTRLASLPLGRPIEAPRSSGFGYRTDPFLGRPALHSGVDFRAPTGSPVRATAAGRVVEAGWNGGYGRMVEIEHAHGISTRYGHLSRIDVKVGDTIVAGQVVGRVGSTGRSTGPHLHYETRRGDRAVNPNPFLRASRDI
ncbi:M23 family metallopeptidase [Afifella sp. IM 167]|uniref:peptidoglycan DD-metalloendopeptidase family protein n=1 Tax=Afifella sp. IM 167 TaxID=2033586 RepID=UPI001CCB3C23